MGKTLSVISNGSFLSLFVLNTLNNQKLLFTCVYVCMHEFMYVYTKIWFIPNAAQDILSITLHILQPRTGLFTLKYNK